MDAKMLAAMIGLALLGVAVPAQAQLGQNNGESFLSAVRDADATKAMALAEGTGSTVVNYRGAKGEAAMHIATRRRDSNWIGFLAQHGADMNVGDDRGETPLLIAARLGWLEGTRLLMSIGAGVDRTNKLGETPLIVAVQARQPLVVRVLLENGANPDKRDSAAGYSARDYARRDARSGELVRMMDSVKSTKKSVSGPVLK